MPNGVDRRAQIDTETVRALLLINGGGAVALLTLLPRIIDKTNYAGLVHAIFLGIVFLMIGLISAVIHNQLRRKCSLHYDQHNMTPPKGKLFGFTLREPTVCCMSKAFMWASVIAFFAAGLVVAVKGLTTFAG